MKIELNNTQIGWIVHALNRLKYEYTDDKWTEWKEPLRLRYIEEVTKLRDEFLVYLKGEPR